jgi:RHS repeat-associated protein
MTANTSVGPPYQLNFAYDYQGRRIEKIVLIGGGPQSTNLFLYDGWNMVAELKPDNTLIRGYLWGTDLSGSPQGAGGVGGLVEMSYAGTNCFVAYDGNGNVAALVNAADGTVVANYEYGPFGEVIRATGPMAKPNPMRFSTKCQDEEADLLYYGYRYYGPSTGRWLSRDPIGEDGGFSELGGMYQLDSVLEPRNEPYLYVFVGNDGINSIDSLGLWKIDRKGGAKAPAEAELGDTIAGLADLIGLNAAEYEKWLTVPSGGTMPGSSGQQLTGCPTFEIPNTVVAYWAGWGRGVGKAYVKWNPSVKYLQARGFKVDASDHTKGARMALQKILVARSIEKELHGLYFWGHGYAPYPSSGLVSESSDALLYYSSTGLYYHMALGLVFACDSNSGKSALMSGNTAEIWHGFSGTLYPLPFMHYHAKNFIKAGQQATY